MRNLLLLLVIVFVLPMSAQSVHAEDYGYVDHIGAAAQRSADRPNPLLRNNSGHTIVRPPSYSVDSKGHLDTTYRPPIIIQHNNYGVQDPGNFGGTYRYNY